MPTNPAYEDDVGAPNEEQLYKGSKDRPPSAKTAEQPSGTPNGTQNGVANGTQNGHIQEKKPPPTPKEGFSPEPDDNEAILQKKRERKPVWFCKQICNWPRVSFG